MAEHKKPITRKASEALVNWCADKSPAARVERTVAQAVIGIISGVVATLCTDNGVVGTVVAPTVMVVFTTVQAEIAKAQENE